MWLLRDEWYWLCLFILVASATFDVTRYTTCNSNPHYMCRAMRLATGLDCVSYTSGVLRVRGRHNRDRLEMLPPPQPWCVRGPTNKPLHFRKQLTNPPSAALLPHLCVVPLLELPLRVTRLDVQLRENALCALLAHPSVLSRLVLFDCKVCSERFHTFHPAYYPTYRVPLYIMKRYHESVVSCSLVMAVRERDTPVGCDRTLSPHGAGVHGNLPRASPRYVRSACCVARRRGR